MKLETATSVTFKVYKPSYVFKSLVRLIAPRVSALRVTAVFLVLGFDAMLQNNVAVDPVGFTQILCTMTHNDGTLNRLAREACLGGSEGIPKELNGLEVRFERLSMPRRAHRLRLLGRKTKRGCWLWGGGAVALVVSDLKKYTRPFERKCDIVVSCFIG